ncbi:hypothetical protein BC629DRAFT_1567449 [Irpex lacteus]|nr:hypothetical protein BC629DRAFT_1567449 [Irpex lacteus]
MPPPLLDDLRARIMSWNLDDRNDQPCEIGLPCPISDSPDLNPIGQAFHTLKAWMSVTLSTLILNPWLVHPAIAPIPALSKACCW